MPTSHGLCSTPEDIDRHEANKTEGAEDLDRGRREQGQHQKVGDRRSRAPCTIELADDGCWVVTIASATTSRREDLAAAILEASGGLVSNAKALELAAAVKSTNRQEP